MTIEELSNSLKEIIEFFKKPFVLFDEFKKMVNKFETLKKEFSDLEERLGTERARATENTPLKSADDKSLAQLNHLQSLITLIENKIAIVNKSCNNTVTRSASPSSPVLFGLFSKLSDDMKCAIFDNFSFYGKLELRLVSTEFKRLIDSRLSSVIEKKIAPYKSANIPRTPRFYRLPLEVRNLILDYFNLVELARLRLVSKKFKTLIDDRLVAEEVISYFINDKRVITFIEKQADSPATLKVLDFIENVKSLDRPARQHIIEVVKAETETLSSGWVFKNPIDRGILILLGLLFATVAPIPFIKNRYFTIIPAVIVFLFVCFTLFRPKLGSAYANIRYGRFFSPQPEQDEENLSTAMNKERFYESSVVETYPQGSINADANFGEGASQATVDKSDLEAGVHSPPFIEGEGTFYDAEEEFGMPRVHTSLR